MPDPPSFLPSAARTVAGRLRQRWILSLVGIVALLAALGLGLGFGLTGGAGDGNDGNFDVRQVVNQAGGYRMTVPKDWQSTIKDTSTQVTAPNKEAIITAGLGPATPLPEAAASFFVDVKSRFDDVQTLGVDVENIGGRPARVFAGIGTGTGGNRVRFLAITIAHRPANYVIAVRAGADSNPAEILPRVNRVVGTFEATRT